jgi:hypothetical protein
MLAIGWIKARQHLANAPGATHGSRQRGFCQWVTYRINAVFDPQWSDGANVDHRITI